ncbi:energy transducer TonB [Granulicella cerasi]|uniref:Energy transducer TonB n=1 Tax=Granulicella cerasi TaxID=741063 RepID=A0ABW1Z837_9BACT|nr:energy transducer TonB [Granulicella cerasi]
MNKLRAVACCVFSCCAFLSTSAFAFESKAEKIAAATERLKAIEVMNSLDGEDMKPWHLKYSYTLHDGAEKSSSGTIEEWWVSRDKWRQVRTEDGKTSVRMRVGGHSYISNDAAPMPAALQTLQDAIVHPVQYASANGQPLEPTQENHKFGSLELSCVMRARHANTEDTVHLGLFPTFCVAADNALRLTSTSGMNIVANLAGKFQGHAVATKLAGTRDGVALFGGTIEELRSKSEDTGDWSTTDLLERDHGLARIGSGVMAGQVISKVQPRYPPNARDHHISGAVVLHAVIGEDGHLRLIEPISFPSAELAFESVHTLSKWVYKPYLLNGVITEVETTVVMNFNLN